MSRVGNSLSVRSRVDDALDVDRVADHAVACWDRILDQPESVVIVRSDENTLVAQTMRLDFSNTAMLIQGERGAATSRQIGVLGVVSHPNAAVLDTDMEPDDEFTVDGMHFKIRDVITVDGEVQARAEQLN